MATVQFKDGTDVNLPIKDDQGAEREFPRHQRGFVDTCFEEGQFEAAIAVLNELRSSKYRPVSPHIRQLLYIALYPPPTEISAENADPDPMSPRKAAKQQKSPLYPSPAAAVAAQRLLMSLARTNSPSGLFRALPSYTDPIDSMEFEEEDSVVGREAVCIKDSKNCWAILREGFIRRKTFAISTPKPKGKGKGRQNQLEEEDLPSGNPSVVAANAWPVLDWIVTIFERDELEQVDNNHPRFSPLLLAQIPSPRGGSVARWEVDIPLEICFFCFQQTEQQRKSAGVRLLMLLINLTGTVYLDMPMFVTSIFTRVSAFTAEQLSDFFSVLEPSPVTCRFKIALCQKLITRTSSTGPGGPADSRPKPQARAQPRSAPVPRRGRYDDQTSIEPSSVLTSSSSIVSKHPSPTSAEILEMLQLPDTQKESARDVNATRSLLQMKFELLVAFGHLQSCVSTQEKDSEWLKILRDGRLDQAINSAFRGSKEECDRTWLKALSQIISIWRN